MASSATPAPALEPAREPVHVPGPVFAPLSLNSNTRSAFLRVAEALHRRAGAALSSTCACAHACTCTRIKTILAAAARPVHAATAIARFLYGGFRGVVVHTIDLPPQQSGSDVTAMALTRDGSHLLVSNHASAVIYVVRISDGAVVRAIGRETSQSASAFTPAGICIARDNFVFVADCDNDHIVVLTPCLRFHGSIYTRRQLNLPFNVCASETIVAVSSVYAGPPFRLNEIFTYDRASGAALSRIAPPKAGPVVNRDFYRYWIQTSLTMLDDQISIADVDFTRRRVCVHDVRGGGGSGSLTHRVIDLPPIEFQVGIACTHIAVSAAGDIAVCRTTKIVAVHHEDSYVTSFSIGNVSEPMVHAARGAASAMTDVGFRGIIAIHNRTILTRTFDNKLVVLR